MSILVKISKNFDIGQNLQKISILVKFSKNFEIFEKFRFFSKNFTKI